MENPLGMKNKVSVSYDEQETVINMSPADKKRANVYTCVPAMLRRMWKLHEAYPDEVKVVKDDKYGSEFEVPEKWIRVRPPRQMSEEARQKAAERFSRFRKSKLDDEDAETEDNDEDEEPED